MPNRKPKVIVFTEDLSHRPPAKSLPPGSMWIVVAPEESTEICTLSAALDRWSVASINKFAKRHLQKRSRNYELKEFTVKFQICLAGKNIMCGSISPEPDAVFLRSMPFWGDVSTLKRLELVTADDPPYPRISAVFIVYEVAMLEWERRLAGFNPTFLGQLRPLLSMERRLPFVEIETGYAVGGYLAKQAIALMRQQLRRAERSCHH